MFLIIIFIIVLCCEMFFYKVFLKDCSTLLIGLVGFLFCSSVVGYGGEGGTELCSTFITGKRNLKAKPLHDQPLLISVKCFRCYCCCFIIVEVVELVEVVGYGVGVVVW